jgi:hypothetical protein
MRKRFAALVVASALVVPAAAEAAPAASTPVDASASQVTQRTMKSALRKDVKRALKAVAKRDLATIASKGFKLKRIRALVAGKLTFTATARSSGQRITVTKGSRKFGKAGKKNVRVKVTRSGKQLLGATNSVTLRAKVTFRPNTGGRVSVVVKATLKRKPGSTIGPEGGTLPPPTPPAPIPQDATPLYSQNFENSDPSSWAPGLTRQCGGTVGWGNDGGDGYAHLELPADATPLAGLERCELSHGEYGDAREPGSYWYHARIRLGEGFPHQPAPGVWTTIQQWQEDEPAAPSGGPDPVDGAMFVNSGPAGATSARTYLQGHYLVPPISQGPLFQKSRWITFIVHGVWTDQPDGYLEWWIDGTYVGRTNGVTSAVGGRHFWKGGITRADAIDALQTADIADLNVYAK